MSNVVPGQFLVIGSHHSFGHPHVSSFDRYHVVRRCRSAALLCAFALLLTCKLHAQEPGTRPADSSKPSTSAPGSVECLPDGSGFLRARLRGSINSDLDWGNTVVDCTGAVRPTDGGIRLRFTGPFADKSNPPARLVMLFGIAKLKEGLDAKAVPVNVTVIREGSGEFYGTQGDDKCTLDEVKQTPLRGIPHRERTYRVIARGFCTEPARSIKGPGSILISRFDFAGRVDFAAEESDQDPLMPVTQAQARIP
jgi:hypothetical protein